jgi:predicted RNase H-like HicB family nuclease
MTTLSYPAIIDKEPGSDFCVIFPDFPGCVSAGVSLEEAIVNAREALAGHVALMAQDGDAFPSPTPIHRVMADQDETTVAVVNVAVAPPGKPKRISITLDDALLDEIDAAGANRSSFLNEAARAELARRRA